ncbi:hypothetical protein LTR93_012261 [Exophiala xenobiotica]|nr:hypothetical protein LTR93_012261 [Exophiala xenobiotica]
MLLMLALGAFARDSHDTNDDPSNFPGIDYFLVANKLLNAAEGSRYTISAVQCRILMAVYLLYGLRTLQAFDTIHLASNTVIALLKLQGRLGADRGFRESCHRAYWACYIIEHELREYISHSAGSLSLARDSVPLPLSDHDEPGIFWLLSEIALRRIFSDVHDDITQSRHTLYAPIIVEELSTQLTEWYRHLPPGIKFSLTSDALYDPHQAFLRTQYYSLICAINWSFVVRLFILDPGDGDDMDRVHKCAKRSLEYGVLYIDSVQYLLQERDPMLFANLKGTNWISMLLLCTYKAPKLRAIAPPLAASAIQKGYALLGIWASNPGIAANLHRLEILMRAAGIPVLEDT